MMTYPELREKQKTERRETITNALAAVKWNKTQAAKRLGLNRAYLHRLMREHGIPRCLQGEP